MWNKLKPKTEFTKNVLTLMTGTTIAQAIPIAISPILTRLYTPEDFGVFSVFSAIVMVLSIISTGRYDSAIILIKSKKDEVNIFILAVLLCSIFSFLLFFFIYNFYEKIISYEKIKMLDKYLYFIPLSIFLISLSQIYINLMNKEKKYKELALSKILQTGSNSFFNVIFGIKHLYFSGLIGGQILSQFFLAIFLFIKSFKLIDIKLFSLKRIRKLFIKYLNFPLYDIPSSFLNILSLQLPIFLLSFLFSPAVVGLFVLSRRIVGLPIILLSSSITTVFKQKASEDYYKYGNCLEIYKKTFVTLIKISIIPSILLLVFAPKIFDIVFGKQWEIAGEYTQIMIPMFFLRFVSSPLSYMFYITNNQRLNMMSHILLVIMSGFGLYLGYLLESVKLSLFFFSLSFSIIYIFYIYKSYNYAKGIRND